MTSDGFESRPVAGQKSGGERPKWARLPSKSSSRTNGAQAKIRRYATAVWVQLVEWRHRWGLPMLLARGAGTAGGLFLLYVFFLWITLPPLDHTTILKAAQSTIITDRDGVELYRIYDAQDRTVVDTSQISQHVKDAVVAIEDRRFFTRGCIDVRALVRSFLGFGSRGGASTLSRQLARNALNLQQENLLSRKIKELMLGCQLEHRYSRDEVLALYLNWIPFGQNAYGVEQASSAYFNKGAKDLTIAESAVLASLPQLPTYFSPYGRHVRTKLTDEALKRVIAGTLTSTAQLSDDDVSIGLLGTTVGTGSHLLYVGGRTDQVLQNMMEQKMITDAERKLALTELKTIVFKASRGSIRAPHFVLWAKTQVERMFEGEETKGILEQGGLTIQTTLDWKLQQAAEAAVAKFRDSSAKVYMGHNIALVAMDPHTKHILAYVGNADYADEEHGGKVDMALAPRAPGSSFKPFIYAGAFLKGYGPATVLHDVRTTFIGGYEPQNYEGGFWGLITIRKALGGSRNIPAIKAYFLGGEEDELLTFASSIGVTTPLRLKPAKGYGPAMAIGAAETPLVEMVQGYATLADGGLFKPAVSIQKITDRNGSLLPLPGDQGPLLQSKEVLDPRVAYEVTSILSDVSARPDAYWQSILSVPGTAAAGKTGTSNKCLERDAKQNCIKRKPDNVWTIGYTPNLVAGVWVGNATSDPLSDKADGLTVAAPIWKDFMTRAQKILLEENEGTALTTTFTMPQGVIQVQVSELSGQLPAECTPVEKRRADIFLRENAPSMPDPACVALTVDKVTGLLTSPSCPVEAQEQKNFYVPRSIHPDRYPAWETGVQAWAKTASGSLPLPLAPTEACDVTKTPGRLEKPSVTLLSPGNGGTASYPSFHPQIATKVGSSIRSVEWQLDGKPLASFTQSPFDGALRVPKSVPKEGMHVLRVTLTDFYYNTATDSAQFSFRTDVSGPGLRIILPEDGATVVRGSPVTMQAEANDTEGGIKYVEFYLDGILLTRKPKEPYALTYPIDLPAGQHRIRAAATDLAGNKAEDEIRITVTEGTGSGTTQ